MKRVILLVWCFATMLLACTTSKHSTKSETKTDSSYVNSLKDENEMLKLSISEYQRQIKEMEMGTATFNKDCPPAVEKLIERIRQLPCDQRIIDSSVNAIKRFYENKIKVMADGSYELSGNLDALTFLRQKLEQENFKLKDSLAFKNKKISELEGRVKKSTEDKKVDKSNWMFWLFLIAAIIVTYFLTRQLYKK